MGKSLRQVRRKMNHQRSDEENILLREQLRGMQKALGILHGSMLRFALGSNWVCHIKTLRFSWLRSGWFWQKPTESIPEYIWVGAGNPEKAAQDTMVACFGKDYKERAQAIFAEMKKRQVNEDNKKAAAIPHPLPDNENNLDTNSIGRGE